MLQSRLDSLDTVESFALRQVRLNDGFTDFQLMDRLGKDRLTKPNVLSSIFNKAGVLARNSTTGKWFIENKYESLVDEFLTL
jgi:hypothetical protein